MYGLTPIGVRKFFDSSYTGNGGNKMSDEKPITSEKEEDKGALFFSFHDDERTSGIIKELQEELVELNKGSKDRKNVSMEILQRHSVRHECHLLSKENLYDIHFKFTDKKSEKEQVFLTAALTPPQAEAILEDHLMREGEVRSPVVTLIEDYGPQPIAWCIDYAEKQVVDVKGKYEALKQRKGVFIKREI